MGNYANWDDVVNRYPKAHTKGGASEMSDSYITGVEAWMDSYLAKQFTTPVAGTPPLLQSVCVDLVYCKIAFNRDKGVPELKKEALGILMSICSGELILVDDSGVQVPSVGLAAWAQHEDYEHSFSELGPLNDLIDPDLLEDLASDRS